MKGRKKMNRFEVMSKGLLLATCIVALLHSGCASIGTTSSEAGGIRALAGPADAASTESALLGREVGDGIGYIIGDEADKNRAREMSQASRFSDYRHQEVGPLGGTRWKLVELAPLDFAPAFKAKIFDFSPNGHVNTTTAYPNGEVQVIREIYRVVGDTIIVNRPGYVINAQYEIKDDQMTLRAKEFKALLVPFDPTDLSDGNAERGFRYRDISFRNAGGDFLVEGIIENRSGSDYVKVLLNASIYDLGEHTIGSSSFILRDFSDNADQPFKTFIVVGNSGQIVSFKVQYSLGRKK
jgi:hypothetical protein